VFTTTSLPMPNRH